MADGREEEGGEKRGGEWLRRRREGEKRGGEWWRREGGREGNDEGGIEGLTSYDWLLMFCLVPGLMEYESIPGISTSRPTGSRTLGHTQPSVTVETVLTTLTKVVQCLEGNYLDPHLTQQIFRQVSVCHLVLWLHVIISFTCLSYCLLVYMLFYICLLVVYMFINEHVFMLFILWDWRVKYHLF